MIDQNFDLEYDHECYYRLAAAVKSQHLEEIDELLRKGCRLNHPYVLNVLMDMVPDFDFVTLLCQRDMDLKMVGDRMQTSIMMTMMYKPDESGEVIQKYRDFLEFIATHTNSI